MSQSSTPIYSTVQPSRPKCERDDPSLPRQIGELAPVAAMHARRDLAAHRAGCGNGAGAADNNNSVGIRQNLLDHQVGRQEGQCIFRQGTTRTPNCSLYVRTRICQCEPTIKFADEPIFHADLQPAGSCMGGFRTPAQLCLLGLLWPASETLHHSRLSRCEAPRL